MTDYKNRSEMLARGLIITIIAAVVLGAAAVFIARIQMQAEMKAKAILTAGFIDNAIASIKSSKSNEAIFSCLLARELQYTTGKDDLDRRVKAAYEIERLK